jgi:hypothetical protein
MKLSEEDQQLQFPGTAGVCFHLSMRRGFGRIGPGYSGVQQQNRQGSSNRDRPIGTLAGGRPQPGKNRGVRQVHGRSLLQELLNLYGCLASQTLLKEREKVSGFNKITG